MSRSRQQQYEKCAGPGTVKTVVSADNKCYDAAQKHGPEL